MSRQIFASTGREDVSFFSFRRLELSDTPAARVLEDGERVFRWFRCNKNPAVPFENEKRKPDDDALGDGLRSERGLCVLERLC